jgi:ornithine cyclodeaminase/alanine dehydrogenase-like protein (mu-crystallin family)
VPLYVSEEDVAALLSPAEAIEAIEKCAARGEIEARVRSRLGLDGGDLAVAAAADLELGVAGAAVATRFPEGGSRSLLLFSADGPELVAIVEAGLLGGRAAGAASGVAARRLAASDASSLGVIGCGRAARSQVEGIRAALPGIERVVAYCRSAERLRAFCAEAGAEPAASHSEAAAVQIVVTATSSPDPVLRGEWLRPGALVCAVGANDGRSRELDNVVLERASYVCCDSVAEARTAAADLIEPVATGVLDWLEVYELYEVVAQDAGGRAHSDDVVVFKWAGSAAWEVAVAAAVLERARERGLGR